MSELQTSTTALASADSSPRSVAARRYKVLQVEDHDLVRVGLRALCSTPACESIEWIETTTLADALRLLGEHGDIQLVLLDLNLADCKGLQGLAQLLASRPAPRVLILSGTHDEFVVRQAMAMGASGYLHKCDPPAAVRESLLRILGLEPFAIASPALASKQTTKAASPSSYDRVAELGPRHLEILELVLSGCSNQEISSSTKLSLGTVKNYVSTILLALDVKSRSHLISLFR